MYTYTCGKRCGQVSVFILRLTPSSRVDSVQNLVLDHGQYFKADDSF